MLNGKKKAFERHNSDELSCTQKEVKTEMRQGKEEYKRKTEENFKSSSVTRVWDGTKPMSGYKGKKGENRTEEC